MPIHSILIEGYRSLVRFPMRLGQITVVTGPNGSGKSNLYRALKLIHRAADGQFARSLAEEGGVESALWSGKPRPGKSRRFELTLSVRMEVLSFQLVAGIIGNPESMFNRDPDIKEEILWSGDAPRPSNTIMHRKGGRVTIADEEGRREKIDTTLTAGESVLSQLKHPGRYPELAIVREQLNGWRFYHQFRTDAGSPMRRPQAGTRSPVLDDDGTNLAAALQTIRENGDDAALEGILEEAFPGCRLVIDSQNGQFLTQLEMPNLNRPMDAHEFSDGTLRFLALAAALLSPRPPELLVLNEPESSLNPGLISPLARLISEASGRSQIWITTHSAVLIEELRALCPFTELELTLVNGETKVRGKENVVFEAWE